MSDQAATDGADPRSAAVTFATTEHFVLQGARSATIAESNGRTNMFLAAVSGGLVALGLVATASSSVPRRRGLTGPVERVHGV